MEKENIKQDFEEIGKKTGLGIFNVDLYLSLFVADEEDLKGYIKNIRLNTDNRPSVEFNTGKNRLKQNTNKLIEVMKHIEESSGKNTVTIPINDLNESEYEEFIGLNFNHGNMNLVKIGQNYLYKNIGTSEMKLEPSKKILFTNEIKDFSLEVKSPKRKPTIDDANYIAQQINSEVINEFPVSNDILYELKSENATGVIGYCEDSMGYFLVYYEYKSLASQIQMEEDKNKLLKISCI